ncbi:CPBP family intramembrane metalloprotease [Vitreoscilla massiliensis]|uniref:CPBP family intramembrane metalloprotease n=1 Tax=Vitreoscilla massiliensis TaxID=1689272 RepID=A0ABY4E3J8_9NEIS|nr:type II CAAX endopeptidase family protein [Vitreoscilla massiliensis]UOO90323.1 CPBP family intramembrane metalloprotease [Vitreoscilla massiliensis]
MKKVFINTAIVVGMLLLYFVPSIVMGVSLLIASKHVGEVFVWFRDLAPLLGMIIATVALLYWAHFLNFFPKATTKFSLKDGLKLVLVFVLMQVWVAAFSQFKPEYTDNDKAIMELMQMFPLWLMFIFICIVAPICEEIIFRGALIGQLFAKHLWWGAAVSTLLFAAIHLPEDAISWLMYGGLGAAFSWVFVRSKQLWQCVVLHMANNLLALASMQGWLG